MKIASYLTIAAATLVFQSCVAPYSPAPGAPVNQAKPGAYANHYHQGFRSGRTDRKSGLSRYYPRHSSQYGKRNEAAFSRGYSDGWDGRAPAM